MHTQMHTIHKELTHTHTTHIHTHNTHMHEHMYTYLYTQTHIPVAAAAAAAASQRCRYSSEILHRRRWTAVCCSMSAAWWPVKCVSM